MENDTMVKYKVNDTFIRDARVTKVNDDGTCDLLVMLHLNDFPEFSVVESIGGHGHRLAVKEGTNPGEFSKTEQPGTSVDPRVDALASKVADLEANVSSLVIQVQKLTTPSASK